MAREASVAGGYRVRFLRVMHRTPTRFRLAAVLVLGVAFGASCSDGADSDSNSLAGRSFILQSSEGYTPVENTSIRVSFEASEFSFSAGCNSHSGPYSWCGDSLCIQDLGSTEMGCDAERHAQDNWLAGFFTASPKTDLTGDQLTLSTTEATLVFLDREVADPDRPLTGVTWTIDTIFDGDSASSLPVQATPTVEFRDDGSFHVFTSCNTGEGVYTAQGTALVLSQTAYTEEVCDASGSDAVDAHIQSVLTDGPVSVEIEAAHLTLMRDTLGIGAMTE